MPVRFVVKIRRLMFLHYLLNESESSLLNQALLHQMKNPSKNYWINQVKNDKWKAKHSKVLHIEHTRLEVQPYLCPENIIDF